jgi:hypothetical protein
LKEAFAMSVPRYTALVACALALTLVSACGKKVSKTPQVAASSNAETSKAAPGAEIDPCSLLSKAQAQTILGEPVTDGRVDKEVGFAPGKRCSYFTSAPIETRGGKYEVYVEVYDTPTFKQEGSYFKSPTEYYKRSRKSQLAETGPDAAKDVSGIGESAFWQPAPGTLNVLDRGVYLILNVHADFHIPPGPSDKVDAEEEAAELQAATQMAKTVVLPKLESLN